MDRSSYYAEWKIKNPNYHSEYRKKNASYFNAHTRARSARVKPIFLHEKKEIVTIYRECPEGYHVDHEIPLNHPLVCGLHCVANLQYLPAKENLAKSNHWIPDWNTDPQ